MQCSRSDLSVTTATSTSGAWAASVVIAALLLIPLAVYFYSPGFRSWKPGDTAASLGALRAAAACAPPAATTTVGTGAVFVARRAHLAHQLLLSTFAVGCAGWLLLSSSLALSWESCDTALYPDDDPDYEFPQTLFFQAAFAPFSYAWGVCLVSESESDCGSAVSSDARVIPFDWRICIDDLFDCYYPLYNLSPISSSSFVSFARLGAAGGGVMIVALLLAAASLVLSAVAAKATHRLAFAGEQPAPSCALHLEAAVATAWTAACVAVIGYVLADIGLTNNFNFDVEVTHPGRTACIIAQLLISTQAILVTIAAYAVRGFPHMRANLCPCCCRGGGSLELSALPVAAPTTTVYLVPQQTGVLPGGLMYVQQHNPLAAQYHTQPQQWPHQQPQPQEPLPLHAVMPTPPPPNAVPLPTAPSSSAPSEWGQR